MKKRYLIKWKTRCYDDETNEIIDWDSYHKICDFSKEELINFTKNKDKIKIKFICNIKDNPVPPLDSLTVSEFESIMYALEESKRNPGLTGNEYSRIITKLKRLQSGVETAKGRPN